jgi:enoyl-CoA hydratase/carnithine racemase
MTEYAHLRVAADGQVVTAVVDNPPLNMLTRELLDDLDRFTRAVSTAPDPLVVVLKSADPDIFMTHAEFANLYAIQPERLPESVHEVSLNAVHLICERLRTMDKITIAQVEGRTAGGAAAMVMACDMRFGALGRAMFNTMSVPLGCVPGGGASQYMPRLIGYSRAMELILAGYDLDAATAERWGYLNRALPPDEIDDFVRRTAGRIAAAPPDAVRMTKEVLALAGGPIEAGLREENFRFRRLIAADASRAAMAAFLELGGQTRDGEQRIEELLGAVLEHLAPEGRT